MLLTWTLSTYYFSKQFQNFQVIRLITSFEVIFHVEMAFSKSALREIVVAVTDKMDYSFKWKFILNLIHVEFYTDLQAIY